MSLLVKLTEVTKIHKMESQEFQALKGIDFQVNHGEMLAIVGASGSGKSTLMNIIGFLDTCTTGTYLFSHQDVSRLEKKQLSHLRNNKIGFIFQSFFLLTRMSALQNVMLPLFYRGTEQPLAVQKSLEMLSKVKMEKYKNHKPNQLSGGQQQRVAIARALVGDPTLILADEPTGALDSKTSQEVMDLLLDLHNREKRSIVIVTHDREVSRLCQRVVTIKDGRIAV